MEKTLTNFIRSLRNAEIRVSTAETLDALSAVELVGYKDKEFLKDSFGGSIGVLVCQSQEALAPVCYRQVRAFL